LAAWLAMTKGSDLELGQVVVGKYRLLDVLGEGGMGVVYLAEHELIEKKIALKVLRKEYSGKADLVQRFKQEAISASRIKHPNVLDVFDFGQLENGCFFLAMEYLQGHDLAAELAQSGVIEPVLAVRLALQMCRALGAAHSRGVVHRDMKPENVFLHKTEEGDDIVKIVDFGIAQLRGRDDKKPTEMPRRRLTRTGVIFGTPEYMSPEQAAGRSVDLRIDVYAMGVMLYEMFSGAVPFTGDSFMAVLSAHLTQVVPPLRAWVPDLDLSAELEAVVMKALAKNPDDRFQSMSELGQAIHQTPEGRMAAPLAGLLPIPKVTHESFRPARGTPAATSPQFVLGTPTAPLIIPVEEQDAPMSLEILVEDNEYESSSPGPRDARRIAGRSGRWLLVALGVAAVLGAGAFVWMKMSHERMVAEASTSLAPSVSVASTPIAMANGAPTVTSLPIATSNAAPSDAGTPSIAGTLPRAESQVTLSVSTEPSGALLFKGGFQVCDATPCTLTVASGEGMELEGRKGTFKGTLRVLAQRDQSVNIVLLPAPPAFRRPAKGSASKSKLCEVVVDGLKILRPCPQ
jgi:eukaryotic-like serine/threonine-protein kinase